MAKKSPPVKKAALKKTASAKKKAPAKKSVAAKTKVSVRSAAPKKKASAVKKKAVAKKEVVAKKAVPSAKAKKKTTTGTSTAVDKAQATTSKGRSSAKKKTTTSKQFTVPSKIEILEDDGVVVIPSKPAYPKAFVEKQRQRLIGLRDELVSTMAGVARGNLREHADSGDASAFGMHSADAGSDAYDRDLALNLLSQEQNALYEIDEALARIENNVYGYCELSGEKINADRLEAIPFARLTVQCQSQLEKDNQQYRGRSATGPIFKQAHL